MYKYKVAVSNMNYSSVWNKMLFIKALKKKNESTFSLSPLPHANNVNYSIPSHIYYYPYKSITNAKHTFWTTR